MYTYLLLEPLDAATFRPLKLDCKTAVVEWHRQNSDKILIKEWYSPLLDGAPEKYSLECSALQGFQTCGLFAWNPKHTDFPKCIGGGD
jgi:hypothetical protein